MKKIGIISDSHHSKENIIKVANLLKDADLILHLGDNIDDCDLIGKILDVEVIGVLGNCDIGKEGLNEKIIEINGVNIFMTHGHKYNVKYNLNTLFYRALELEADIVLFGHTHYYLNVEEDGIIFFNPGSIYNPRGRKDKTFGILEIDDNGINIQHFILD